MRTPTAPPSADVLLLAWQPDPVVLAGAAVAAGAYGCGLARLARRGDRWPLARTASFGLGLLTVLAVTCTGLGRYGMASFSVHMVQHMVLSMISPILLLLGAPLTLALRALPTCTGAPGIPRRLLLAAVHSRIARIATWPPVAVGVFIVSLYSLYFTPLFTTVMASRPGHLWMLAHFLAVGLLFFWPVIGIDPAPKRPPHGFRMLMLAVTAPFHAFFGIAVMSSTAPLGPDHFAHAARLWDTDPMEDQARAGAIAWAFSEIPTLLTLAVVFLQWNRSERRTATRHDRRAVLDGDAELAAYNKHLSALARGRAAPAMPSTLSAPQPADLLPPGGPPRVVRSTGCTEADDEHPWPALVAEPLQRGLMPELHQLGGRGPTAGMSEPG